MNPLAEALGVDQDGLSALIATLRERGETVATAESLTAGLLCATLTSVPGASAVVAGGLVVYATELKSRLAGVDEHTLRRLGPVDPEIATQLAEGAARRCGATWGIGLTGVAGPDPQNGVAPGVVHLGLAGPDGVAVRSLALPGGRHEVRSSAVVAALELLGDHLASTAG